jgi:hypothetical protein
MVYSLTISAIYALLFFLLPGVAGALSVFFVALLLGPACWNEWEKVKKRKQEEDA